MRVSGIAAGRGSVWSAGVGANASESECRGAYANGSDMAREGAGAYANGSDMAGEGVGAYAGDVGSVWSTGGGA